MLSKAVYAVCFTVSRDRRFILAITFPSESSAFEKIKKFQLHNTIAPQDVNLTALPNNSFNPTGMSLSFIENLLHDEVSPGGLIRALGRVCRCAQINFAGNILHRS